MQILFVKFGSFSHINDMVYRLLREEYPDYDLDILDIRDTLKYKISYYHLIINIYFFIREYGSDIILRKKHWKESSLWFFATSYISIQISKLINKFSQGKKYKFTFQSQSLFNGKIEGIPHFIYTDHTTQTNLLYPDINPRKYMRSKRFINRSEIKIYQDATMIFTMGSLPSYSLINQYKIPKEKVLTVFAGSNAVIENFNRPDKYYSQNILFVGVEWERKGGPILLKVFSNVLKRYPDATLTIVGCSPKNISVPNCNIVGLIPLESISEYYNSANVFCLPTLREPFGMVFIEAMNYRLPIIANNIGSLSDFVINDYNGYLIENNVNDYTEAICRLFDNPEKCKIMGENGYQYAQSKFTWEIVGKTIKSNIDKWLL